MIGTLRTSSGRLQAISAKPRQTIPATLVLPHGFDEWQVVSRSLPLAVLTRLLSHEYIITDWLIELYVLHFVFGEECTCRHLKSLGKTHRNQHAVEILEF